MKINIKSIILERMMDPQELVSLGTGALNAHQLSKHNANDVKVMGHDLAHRKGLLGMSSMGKSHLQGMNISPGELAKTQNDLTLINHLTNKK